MNDRRELLGNPLTQVDGMMHNDGQFHRREHFNLLGTYFSHRVIDPWAAAGDSVVSVASEDSL